MVFLVVGMAMGLLCGLQSCARREVRQILFNDN